MFGDSSNESNMQSGIVKLNLSDVPRSMNERRCMALKIGINHRSTWRQSRFSSASESARGASSPTLRTSSQLAFINNRGYPGGPSVYEEQEFSIGVDEIGNVSYVLANWFADSMLV